MRRRGWRHRLHDRPTRIVLLLAGGFLAVLAVPRGYEAGKDAVRTYRVSHYVEPIAAHADAAGLDRALVRAVVLAESSGNPNAHSKADAKGLMQITPITHEEVMRRFDLPAGDLYDPDYNLRVGTTYLAYLHDRFDHDRTLALAAYHMGPTRVAKLRREHPELSPEELVQEHAGPKTRAYIKRVLQEAEP